MIIGIEASNIGSGGGITHLRELLASVQPKKYGIKKVEVWSRQRVLEQLPGKTMVNKKTQWFTGKRYLRTFILADFSVSPVWQKVMKYFSCRQEITCLIRVP